jgi:hypothetical protein
MAPFRPGVMGMRAERTRFLHRSGHDGSRGSPKFFTAQRTPVQNDNSLIGVLLDTPVWRLALRPRAPDLNVRERALTGALSELIREGRAQMIGAIRQDLLSGIREEEKFVTLRNYLRAFDE